MSVGQTKLNDRNEISTIDEREKNDEVFKRRGTEYSGNQKTTSNTTNLVQ